MPHIVMDYSPDLEQQHDIGALCQTLFDTLIANPAFPDPDTVKVRAAPWPHYLVGGRKESFAHVTLRLMPGRDATTKREISDALLAALRGGLPNAASLTVELTEIDRDSYSKSTL